MLLQPLSPAQARHLLLNILAGDGIVLFGSHARRQMQERGVSELMVYVALEDGEFAEAYMERGSWRHKVTLQDTVVVIAFHHEHEVAIVTVFLE
jgi:hypothetical protein